MFTLAQTKARRHDRLYPKVNTGPNDFAPVKQMQMMRFSGASWELFGGEVRG
jgi:branched-chain amino acid transport system substrate-binding protein